jgi:glycosyltransferase involved in cell wall biosynthesis
MKVAFLAHTVTGNALGRTYSLWLLAEELGWESRVHVPRMDTIWAPLQDEPEFRSCLTPGLEGITSADVLVAVKPLLGSFGTALMVRARTGQPLVLDVDDPDWEWAYGFAPRRARRRALRRTIRGRPAFPVDRLVTRRQHLAAYREFRLGAEARRIRAVTISNPTLAAWYPGEIVPHVRRPGPAPTVPAGHALRVAFVGTPRRHKGIEVLRAAAQAVDGVHLVVTADPPPDAAPNEEWVGQTTLEAGLRIVDEADVIALPSLDADYAPYQLPVKLIDAMVAGRPIVASDLPPLRWAAEGAALFVPPGDVESLAAALRSLQDGALRERLGRHGREAALARFTPEAVAPAFAAVVDGARLRR